jgi:diguanylate cyclase (GGDEF)-like protein/PAS domain S-box-containing protein
MARPSNEARGRCLYSAQVPVMAGFGVMILLLIGVAAIGISHIRSLGSQLTAVVAERNLKSDLASSMKALNDARYQTILLASNMDDPFERDEQKMRFDAMASDFVVLRDRFLALPLGAEEWDAWGEVRKELPIVEDLANQSFDLIQADKLDQARRMIREDLKRHQTRMMEQWDRLVEMQRVKNAEAVSAATVASERARGLVLGLSGAALLVAVGVALLVVRASRRMEEELFKERERAVVTLRSLGDAVIRFDQERRIGYLNPAAEALLGMDEEKAAAMPVGEVLRLYERDTRADLAATLLDEVQKGMAFVLPASACLLSAQELEYEVEGKCSCIHASDGKISGGVMVMSDVTEARELQRKLLWHSDHDVLTGLANRYAFEARLAQSLASDSASETGFSLLLISLDQLKQVREQAGNAGSDELVRQLAHLMNVRLRESDFLARLGEDEFGILLQSCPDELAERIAAQIRNNVIGLRHSWQGKTYRVGVHIGVAHLSGKTYEECLAAAYSALHEAETKGPGSVVVNRP